MTTKVIEYKSSQITVISDTAAVLETGEKDGIRHTWSGYLDEYDATILTWKFNWEDLKIQGFDRLVGHLNISNVYDDCVAVRVDIDWTETDQSISETLGRNYLDYDLSFEYYLTAHSTELPPPEKISYDEMFAASDKTDGILIVEGKKLNVNKSFLSFHSDYFSTLFSATFKEGQMKEIEIKEVTYEDFGLLLSTIYPMMVFPNDKTTEKLLEFTDRFLMPSVKHLVEHHLLEHSKLENEKMMMLGDRYGIKSVLERSIRQTNTVEKMKKLKMSPEYGKLSTETVARLFERFVQIS
ncbi:hypothetical protein B9Z55_007780 [Caenorhabditis nigoni]|nr:hypothetical protein B9Z55_007780 [Caenorhabditis nigoni]